MDTPKLLGTSLGGTPLTNSFLADEGYPTAQTTDKLDYAPRARVVLGPAALAQK